MTSLRIVAVSNALIIASVLYVPACFAESSRSVQANAPAQDYCGWACASRCAEQLGVRFGETPAALRLRNTPVASLREIQEALEEAGLHTLGFELSRDSLPSVRRIFLKQLSPPPAIGWVEYKKSNRPGHFFVVSNITADNEVFGYDAATGEVLKFVVDENGSMPILAVSADPLDSSHYFARILAIVGGPILFGCLCLSFVVIVAVSIVQREQICVTRKLTLISFSAMLLIVSLSVAGTFSRDASNSFTDAPLTFEEQEIDLGNVAANTTAYGTFILVNNSDSVVTVSGVEVSCGCVEAELQKTKIEPKEKVAVKVKMSEVNIGLNRHSLALIGDGFTNTTSVVCNGTPSAAIRPANVIVGSIVAEGPSKRFTVQIVNFEGPPLKNMHVVMQSKSPRFRIELVENKLKQSNSLRYDMVIHPLGFRGFVTEAYALKGEAGGDHFEVHGRVSAELH